MNSVDAEKALANYEYWIGTVHDGESVNLFDGSLKEVRREALAEMKEFSALAAKYQRELDKLDKLVDLKSLYEGDSK